MPWKEDGKGGLAVENGAPVWGAEDGEEKRVDYEAMTKRLADVTKESIERILRACGDIGQSVPRAEDRLKCLSETPYNFMDFCRNMHISKGQDSLIFPKLEEIPCKGLHVCLHHACRDEIHRKQSVDGI